MLDINNMLFLLDKIAKVWYNYIYRLYFSNCAK